MKLAIMQPYFLPYIGYFQLINAVDKFILYDDVAFIKQGWINRNYILVNKQKHLITLPLAKISSYKLIMETFINLENIPRWYKKFLYTIEFGYKKAPYYKEVLELLIEIFGYINQTETISEFNKVALKRVCQYLGIDTNIKNSNGKYHNNNLSGKDRVIDICNKENATIYINAIGGYNLYVKEEFGKNNIQLYFLRTKDVFYKQFDNEFIPNLSIIDVMMFNSIKDINKMLGKFELL